ncbi:hypothetical protein BST61_g11123 [Cercospora zeina]
MAQKMTQNHGKSANNVQALLRSRLQNIPQELFDQIYDFTFTAESKIRIYLSPDSTLPSPQWLAKRYPSNLVAVNERLPDLARVDRHSRAQYKASYFGNPNSIFAVSGFEELESWAENLDPNALCMIPKIYYIGHLNAELRSHLVTVAGEEFEQKVEAFSHSAFRKLLDSYRVDESQFGPASVPLEGFPGDKYGKDAMELCMSTEEDIPLPRRRAHLSHSLQSIRRRRARKSKMTGV